MIRTLVALALLIPTLAQASPITVISTDGSWSGAVPAAAINNTDAPGVPSTIRWGNGPHQSGYDYTPVVGPFGVLVDGAAFLLGTFTHHNWPITGPVLTDVTLPFNLDWDLFSPGLVGGFAFTHHETPNGANPCAYAGANGQGVNAAGCADRVLISSPFLNTFLSDGTDTMFFTLVGFSTDGGATTSHQYMTMEGQTNTAGLYGRLTSIPITDEDPESVPEPATLALFGVGLAGLACRLRKRAYLVTISVLCLASPGWSQTPDVIYMEADEFIVATPRTSLLVGSGTTDGVVIVPVNTGLRGVNIYSTVTQDTPQFDGLLSKVVVSGGTVSTNATGIGGYAEVTTGGTVTGDLTGVVGIGMVSGTAAVANVFGVVGATILTGTATVANTYGLYTNFTKDAGATSGTNFGVWVSNLVNTSTGSSYPLWYEGGGGNCNTGAVTRINHFGIFAHYNPCFAAYHPDSANFERIILRWGDSGVYGTDNVAYIGVEPGGTGTNRHLQLIGGGLSFSPTLVTPAITGTRFLCISTTGVVRSSVVPCKGT